MNVINFKNTNCAHCYKCLRNCRVNAIRIKNGQAQIVTDMCIYCGNCVAVCPQQAKSFESDLDMVKTMLIRGEKIIVTIDPSYRGLIIMDSPGQIVDALQRLGFRHVRETAEAAAMVTMEYVELLKEGKMDNIITSACPSVNYLIEKYYPSLTQYLAPVISPAIAHGKIIKRIHGDYTKVVFIGPCVAKKMEAEIDPRTRGSIDAVIEFSELKQWLEDENINIHDCMDLPFENDDPKVNKLYAVNNGISRAVKEYGDPGNYKHIVIDSRSECREFLHAMREGDVHNCFVEMHLCAGGCVNGPGVDKERGFRFKAEMAIEETTEITRAPEPKGVKSLSHAKMERTFEPHNFVEANPTENQIEELLKIVGRANSKTEFNCGACGFLSCRDMAVAIFKGNAEPQMCLVRSYENARSNSNIVMESTPSIIIIYDDTLRIHEFNRRAQEVFGMTKIEAVHKYLYDIVDVTDFEKVVKSGEDIHRVKRKWEFYNMVVLETIVHIKATNRYLAIIEDITLEETKNDKIFQTNMRTLEIAQSVIDKQMTTAQQIAGLLGETTAETKAVLVKLKDSLLNEMGEQL